VLGSCGSGHMPHTKSAPSALGAAALVFGAAMATSAQRDRGGASATGVASCGAVALPRMTCRGRGVRPGTSTGMTIVPADVAAGRGVVLKGGEEGAHTVVTSRNQQLGLQHTH